MSGGDTERAAGDPGATTAGRGTPFAVDISGDRPDRRIWAAFLAGPVIVMTHFMVVYLVAEAGCTGDGPGLDALDPPLPRVVTLVATGLASLACLAVARWNHRRWRASRDAARTPAAGWPYGDVDDHDGAGSMAFAGLLLAAFSCATVVLVGLAAPFLESC